MSAPRFAPVDDYTADLLSLVADTDHPSVDYEWQLFREALITASLFDGIVRQNDMRPMIAGRIASRRVGPLYRKACLEGLIVPTGDYEISDDAHGRNVGKPCRSYRRTSAGSIAAASGTAGSPRPAGEALTLPRVGASPPS